MRLDLDILNGIHFDTKCQRKHEREWEYQIISLIRDGSILLNDHSHHVVNPNLDAVSCLDRCDFDVIVLDVIPLQRRCIGVS